MGALRARRRVLAPDLWVRVRVRVRVRVWVSVRAASATTWVAARILTGASVGCRPRPVGVVRRQGR